MLHKQEGRNNDGEDSEAKGNAFLLNETLGSYAFCWMFMSQSGSDKSTNQYMIVDRDYDNDVYNNKILHVNSAGNTVPSVGSPGKALNVLTVGNFDHETNTILFMTQAEHLLVHQHLGTTPTRLLSLCPKEKEPIPSKLHVLLTETPLQA